MRRLISAFMGVILAALPASAMELVMVEQAGCHWCAVWNEEIGPIYPKTDEGKTAPLRRIDLHRPVPEDLTIGARPSYTPTFILVKEGIEFGRLEGYPGEHFFWPLIAEMIARANGATPVMEIQK